MAAVVDSGPIIALSSIGHFAFLQERFGELLIPPGVEREIIVQGAGRAHQRDLGAALAAKVAPSYRYRIRSFSRDLLARRSRPQTAR